MEKCIEFHPIIEQRMASSMLKIPGRFNNRTAANIPGTRLISIIGIEATSRPMMQYNIVRMENMIFPPISLLLPFIQFTKAKKPEHCKIMDLIIREAPR